MKILVSIKRVIDYNVHIRVKADGSGVETQNVKMSMNPFDAIALEEAVRLKEKNLTSEIVVVSVGNLGCQEMLRQALAMGADRAMLINSEKSSANLEPLCIAKILEKITLKEKPDLVLLGKQAIDDDCNQTGQMLAGLLDWPQGTFISKLEINQQNQEAIVTREIDGGLEILALDLPAVLTTDLRLNEPRFVSLPNIMQAKRKPLEIIDLLEIIPTLPMPIEVISVSEPLRRKTCKILNSIEELIPILTQEKGEL